MTYGTAYFSQGLEVKPSSDNLETIKLYNNLDKACLSLASGGDITMEAGSLSAPQLTLDDQNFSIVSKQDFGSTGFNDKIFQIGEETGVFLCPQTSASSGSLTISDTDFRVDAESGTITLNAPSTQVGSLLVDGVANAVINSSGNISTPDYVESNGQIRANGSMLANLDFKAAPNNNNVYQLEVDSDGLANFKNDTDATSSADGALVVAGGVGVSKSLYVGADLSVGGKFSCPVFKTEEIVFDSATTEVSMPNAPVSGSCMLLVRGDQGYTATYVLSKVVGTDGVSTRLSHGIGSTSEGIDSIAWREDGDLTFTRSVEWTTLAVDQTYYITLISS